MDYKPMKLTGLLVLAFFVTACSQPGVTSNLAVAASLSSPTPTHTALPPTPTSTPLPECNADETPYFVDYATWTKINDQPILGHETRVNIYANDLAEGIYQSASGEVFPACAMIVKTHLDDPESGSIHDITVMVKMPAGYDPEHNDWWWGMYDKSGKIAEMSGKVQVCIECHQPLSSDDYVFSKAVMSKFNK